MKHQTPIPPKGPGPEHAPHPTDDQRKPAPVEPIEVLGRHKNSGQKDHKGAR